LENLKKGKTKYLLNQQKLIKRWVKNISALALLALAAATRRKSFQSQIYCAVPAAQRRQTQCSCHVAIAAFAFSALSRYSSKTITSATSVGQMHKVYIK
jgi:hypothetical protein